MVLLNTDAVIMDQISFFQLRSNTIHHIMHLHGFMGLWNYIVNLIYADLPSQIHQSYEFLLSLLQELGLDISTESLWLEQHWLNV